MNEGEDTLYNPDATEDDAVKAVEEELEDAVARYAEDNLLVARVRKDLPSRSENDFLRQVFLKDPYYQKLTRDRTTSGNSFFGSAGGSLFPTVSSKVVGWDSVAGSLSSRCWRSDIMASSSSLQSARAEKCPM